MGDAQGIRKSAMPHTKVTQEQRAKSSRIMKIPFLKRHEWKVIREYDSGIAVGPAMAPYRFRGPVRIEECGNGHGKHRRLYHKGGYNSLVESLLSDANWE